MHIDWHRDLPWKNVRPGDREKKSINVAFEDGTEATGDFAIGCDGINSRVRTHVYPSSTSVFQHALGLMGTVFPSQLTDILGPQKKQDTKRWSVGIPRTTFGKAGMFGTVPADFSETEFGFMTVHQADKRSRQEWARLGHHKVKLKEIMEGTFLVEKGRTQYPKEC